MAQDPTWHLLRCGARSAAENMAMDDVLLELASTIGRPLLRFYSWSEPAASFGYSQRFSDVSRLTVLRPLVRRPTGGGLVPHDADWTYSLVFPPSASWYSLKAKESYQRVHGWVQAAFEKITVATQLAVSSRKEAAGQCFAGAEQFDVLWKNRKVAGAAQRRTRDGLLIQGSIQPPPGIGRSDWEPALCEVAHKSWGVVWELLQLPAATEQMIQQRAREKFGTVEFTERR